MTLELGETVPEIRLRDSSGGEVTLQQHLDRPTIVQCMRYFG